MNQVEKEEAVLFKYEKSKKHFDWSDKSLSIYKGKDKSQDKNGIIITFVNQANISVHIKPEVNGECIIIITFKDKKDKILKNSK